jgi:hypothetical protein
MATLERIVLILINVINVHFGNQFMIVTHALLETIELKVTYSTNAYLKKILQQNHLLWMENFIMTHQISILQRIMMKLNIIVVDRITTGPGN